MEEHSMDQCRSRFKLSENFERHWSIPISVGKFIWTNHWSIPLTNGPETSSKVFPYTLIGPWMAIPSDNFADAPCNTLLEAFINLGWPDRCPPTSCGGNYRMVA